MDNLYLLARIHGSLVAIASKNVESVVTVQDVVPVPQASPSVAGLFALRSRVLTLIDSQYLITGQSKKAERGALAIVAEIAGHPFGLIVESADDVVSIHAEQIERSIKPDPVWARFVSETAVIDGQMVMILNPAAMVGADDDALAA